MTPRNVTPISTKKEVELKHTSLRALSLVQEKPAITLSQVSEVLQWTAEKTAFILNILEQKRLIRSEYVTERTEKGEERKRRLFPCEISPVIRKTRKDNKKLPYRMTRILSHIRKEGYDVKIEQGHHGGEYILHVRSRREKRTRTANYQKPVKDSNKMNNTGYKEGSRIVRPNRRRNKS